MGIDPNLRKQMVQAGWQPQAGGRFGNASVRAFQAGEQPRWAQANRGVINQQYGTKPPASQGVVDQPQAAQVAPEPKPQPQAPAPQQPQYNQLQQQGPQQPYQQMQFGQMQNQPMPRPGPGQIYPWGMNGGMQGGYGGGQNFAQPLMYGQGQYGQGYGQMQNQWQPPQGGVQGFLSQPPFYRGY